MTVLNVKLGWSQLTGFARSLCFGLPKEAHSKYRHLIFMAPESLGLRIVTADGSEPIPEVTLTNRRKEGGTWHGYAAENISGLEWAPASNRETSCVVATKTETGRWSVIFAAPVKTDVTESYRTCLALVCPDVDPKLFLRLRLRQLTAYRLKQREQIMHDCYQKLKLAVQNGAKNPFAKLPKSVRQKISIMGSENLKRVFPPSEMTTTSS